MPGHVWKKYVLKKYSNVFFFYFINSGTKYKRKIFLQSASWPPTQHHRFVTSFLFWREIFKNRWCFEGGSLWKHCSIRTFTSTVLSYVSGMNGMDYWWPTCLGRYKFSPDQIEFRSLDHKLRIYFSLKSDSKYIKFYSAYYIVELLIWTKCGKKKLADYKTTLIWYFVIRICSVYGREAWTPHTL